MALALVDFVSKELQMNTLVTVCFPDSVRTNGVPLSERKVLWLLHGLSDDGTAWLRNAKIELYARENDLVLVMPSVGRSMYCDQVLGQNYFSFITKELPDYFSCVFGLSGKREQNFIAGLSMGGFGAMRAALTYPERYAAVGSFSGILDLTPLALSRQEQWEREFPFLLKDAEDPENSPLNPKALLPQAQGKELSIYVACGLQDDLLITNERFCARAKELNISHTYVTENGSHEWNFWDRHLERFISLYMKK